MKGERIVAELISLLSMVIYAVLLQHLYSQLLNKPETSWLNMAKTWWLTRGSRRLERRLRVFTLEQSVDEPAPSEGS